MKRHAIAAISVVSMLLFSPNASALFAFTGYLQILNREVTAVTVFQVERGLEAEQLYVYARIRKQQSIIWDLDTASKTCDVIVIPDPTGGPFPVGCAVVVERDDLAEWNKDYCGAGFAEARRLNPPVRLLRQEWGESCRKCLSFEGCSPFDLF